ncbi:MAG: DNA photolyase FAD-binding protein [Telmatospirillum sp.]|nr:DNA photolyase FAD-binding protein [Telmatospirillum sp.]
MTLPAFPPTRAAALNRLEAFVPGAGPRYAAARNTDPGLGRESAVSRLSPYLRYRLVTEAEVVGAVLAQHTFAAAEKFVQEVLWRTYWKGWLELHPTVWSRFLSERDALKRSGDVAAAERGETGIEGFDDWARELVETGYLHNHARMWFASIWIFTLRLPWTLGADFFLRHLIDADPASNTLSWRWVAGLQTVGKTYLATRDNIARCTEGRFAPRGLATQATALTEAPLPPARPLALLPTQALAAPAILLATPEDLHPESLFDGQNRFAGAIVAANPDLLWGNHARTFVHAAAADTATRIERQFGCPARISAKLDAASVVAAARQAGVAHVATAAAPVGPVADSLAQLKSDLAKEGIALANVRRRWDGAFWPHATRGFFALKKQIPVQLREFGVA